MKAIKQRRQDSSIRVTLIVENHPESEDNGHNEAALKIRQHLALAMLGNAEFRNDTEQSQQEVDTLNKDAHESDLPANVKQVQFTESILRARTSRNYKSRQDGVTVGGHMVVLYHSVTAGIDIEFAIARRVPLELIDAMNEVYTQDFVVVEQLPDEPGAPPLKEKVAKEPKSVAAASLIR